MISDEVFEEFLDATKSREKFDLDIKLIAKTLKESNWKDDEYDRFSDLFYERCKSRKDEFLQINKDSMSEYLTDDDLKNLVEFWKSNLGEKLIAFRHAQESIANKAIALSAQIADEVIKELQEEDIEN